MPAKVPIVVLKGLAEGLTLRAAERGPVTANSLVDHLEALLDHRPHDNQVESVLRDLAEGDLVRRPEPEEGFQLTQDGARRLEAYRRLPTAFKTTLVDLFRIEARPGLGRASTGSHKASAADDGATWVDRALAGIPRDVEVQARHARVRLDRDPMARTWTLTVDRHEPGRYANAEACPLTFLYRAATAVVSRSQGPARATGVSRQAPSPR